MKLMTSPSSRVKRTIGASLFVISGSRPLHHADKELIFDSPGLFPLVLAAAAGGKQRLVKRAAWRVVQNVSTMKKKNLSAGFLGSPGVAALLEEGLKSTDGAAAQSAAASLSNVTRDETTAKAVITGHPALVLALADAAGTGGVCKKFHCAYIKNACLFQPFATFLDTF